MKVVFICGPYRARTIHDVVQNIRRAEAYAKKYWKLGYAVICPHMNTALFDGLLPDEVWLSGMLEVLRRCDVVVLTLGWNKSEGSRVEADEALKANKEIITDDEILLF